MLQKYLSYFLPVLGICLSISHNVRGQTLPEGFSIDVYLDGTELVTPTGMVHAENISYVWELDGIIWPVINGVKSDEAIIDIKDEVGRWGDHGLLSVVLHPDFSSNGWMYLLYVVDRYHLYNSESDTYDPDQNEYDAATIGRVVRYTVDLNDLSSLQNEERTVLIGQTPQDGIPVPTFAHGLGDMCFGSDGSLLVSVGDSNAAGTNYNGTGEVPDLAYDDQALADGILKPGENVGAFRSQYLNTYCGKIFRINPETGEAYPSNPFYDPDRATEPISKVYALGFRNAYRLEMIPGTGDTDPAAGNPGHIICADVGDWAWEEINFVTEPGQNFGWPIFQGPEYYWLFEVKYTEDPENPLDEPCEELSNYRFQDLIVQPREQHDEVWQHPCGGEIPSNVHRFVHTRPKFSYANDLIAQGQWAPEDSCVVPTFDADGNATFTGITHPDIDIQGAKDFTGTSGTTGMFLDGDAFPDEYASWYIQTDLIGWLKAFKFDAEYNVTEIRDWSDDIGFVVYMSENLYDGNIYFSALYPVGVNRLSFDGNLAPVIEVEQDTILGVSPLTIDFDASQSYDPEDDPLTFHWDFGDGVTSSEAVVSHTFESPESGGQYAFDVVLTVSDNAGNSREKKILVSLNNSYPEAEIIGISPKYMYSIQEPTTLLLNADIFDAESPLEELDIRWDVYLHHNAHYHLEKTFTELSQNVIIQPFGCGIETYWYRIALTVTDPQGLVAKTSWEIFPDCEGGNPYSGEFMIFPNPTVNRFVIKYPSDPGKSLVLRFYDLSGEEVAVKRHAPAIGESEYASTTSDLSSGVYVVTVESDNWSESGKLIVTTEE